MKPLSSSVNQLYVGAFPEPKDSIIRAFNPGVFTVAFTKLEFSPGKSLSTAILLLNIFNRDIITCSNKFIVIT